MLDDYLKEIAKRRAKRMQEKQTKRDFEAKETWKLAPEDFEQPTGVYAFMKKKKDEDEDE